MTGIPIASGTSRKFPKLHNLCSNVSVLAEQLLLPDLAADECWQFDEFLLVPSLVPSKLCREKFCGK